VALLALDGQAQQSCFPPPVGLSGWWDSDAVTGTAAFGSDEGEESVLFPSLRAVQADVPHRAL
jgi:hypothetical protein